MLRMTDHIALTKDGVHFNTQRGRHWINDVFQTQLREAEQESRATGSLARANSTRGSRNKGNRARIPRQPSRALGTGDGWSRNRRSELERERQARDCSSSQAANRLEADSADRWNRTTGITPRPRLGGTIRLPRQILLRQQDRLQVPCQRRGSNQAAGCFGIDQILVIGVSIRRTCRRS